MFMQPALFQPECSGSLLVRLTPSTNSVWKKLQAFIHFIFNWFSSTCGVIVIQYCNVQRPVTIVVCLIFANGGG